MTMGNITGPDGEVCKSNEEKFQESHLFDLKNQVLQLKKNCLQDASEYIEKWDQLFSLQNDTEVDFQVSTSKLHIRTVLGVVILI